MVHWVSPLSRRQSRGRAEFWWAKTHDWRWDDNRRLSSPSERIVLWRPRHGNSQRYSHTIVVVYPPYCWLMMMMMIFHTHPTMPSVSSYSWEDRRWYTVPIRIGIVAVDRWKGILALRNVSFRMSDPAFVGMISGGGHWDCHNRTTGHRTWVWNNNTRPHTIPIAEPFILVNKNFIPVLMYTRNKRL